MLGWSRARIGKSSLLYHIYQTYPQRLPDPGRFLIGYVSLQDARVRTLTGFLQTMGNALAGSVGTTLRGRDTAAVALAMQRPGGFQAGVTGDGGCGIALCPLPG